MSGPPPNFCTVKRWQEITGMSKTRTYAELGKGNLQAIKIGRGTLIDAEAGLNWLRTLPRVHFAQVPGQ